MLNRFLRFIEEEHLFAQGQQMLLAVSGGRDSVALTDLTARAGIPFAIAHCNFNLRPGDCDRDEDFVRHLAARYDVPFFVARFETESYAHSKGLSIEEAARFLRYDFFKSVCRKEGFPLIATAHHQDDSIETFFINLIRGTGIAGLHGIVPRNDNIVRPLLCFNREEINQYIAEQGLSYVEDVTNGQPLYLRNRIRLQLLPLLRQLSPAFDATMLANMQRLSEVEQVYRNAVADTCRQLLQPFEGGFAIPLAELRELRPLPTFLFELLRPFGFSSSSLPDALALLNASSGKQIFSKSHRLLKDRDRLLLLRREAPGIDAFTVESVADLASLPVALAYEIAAPDHAASIRLQPSQAWFDLDTLRFPLLLRRWRKGDRFKPFGLQGSRAVSDLFTDAHYSRWDKEHAWLLCDAENAILWIIGLRTSAVAIVTRQTRRILKLQLR